MNILIPDSWLRNYLQTDATPQDIQRCLSLCGPSVERLHKTSHDYVYDIEITTNRPDLMSVIGIAGEANAILPQFGFSASFNKPKFPHIFKLPPVDVEFVNDDKLCHRIVAFKVEHVKVAPSPDHIAKHLEAVGQRPLNNLVDLTNYVMWEVGHPTHVFDYDRLTTKKMVIRQAKKGEQLTTLDKKTHTLLGGEAIIDDGTGNIIDLPCIMGTDNSVVTPDTTSAMFFIEDIDPVLVRTASMNLGIRTQAAVLKEKDIDPNLSYDSAQRLIQLIKQIMPQAKITAFTDIYPHPYTSKPISVSFAQINQLIGVDIPASTATDIMTRLGFQVKATSKILTVTPPTWRSADIQIPQDIIEEIARIYGYFNLPPVIMPGSLPPPLFDSAITWENRIKTALKYLGFTEVYTYSLVANDPQGLALNNPLSSEWTTLRTSLAPSHLQVVSENRGRVEDINIFEIANIYLPQKDALPEEQTRLIVTSASLDFSHFKGVIEALLSDLGITEITPEISSENNIYTWEIPFADILTHAKEHKTYHPISKYTPIIEDFNITYAGSYAKIVAKIKAVSPLIKDIELIDTYQQKLTLRLTFHSDDRQLSSSDLDSLRPKLLEL